MTNLYAQLAQSFSNSRVKPEPGWLPLLKLDFPAELKILDIGCANARLFRFLSENLPNTKISYTGIDNSSELLAIAQAEFGAGINLLQIDLITQLEKLQELVAREKFDLITLHAVMHHIPQFAYRQRLLAMIATGLKPQGYLHVSFWQFGEYARYQDKINFPAEKVGMRQAELEERDFVMSWQRDGLAFRFCHWANESELKTYNQLLTQQGLELVTNYRADGKEGDQNWYWLWRKH